MVRIAHFLAKIGGDPCILEGIVLEGVLSHLGELWVVASSSIHVDDLLQAIGNCRRHPCLHRLSCLHLECTQIVVE